MKKLGEFERIARYFSPLVEGQEDALGLRDDAALITPPPGKRMAVTADALVAGVHFLADDPADRIARKALRVNISDLAAMGAEPYGYTLALALPRDFPEAEAWLETFTAGQRADHAEFGIRLLGGDSVSTPGPLSISVTAFGWVPADKALMRSGAHPGDEIYVSGTIGDSGLGLAVLRGECTVLDAGFRAFLADRYHIPHPRPLLGQALLGIASAALDVSDGLLQDLGHIVETSGLLAEIRLSALPRSEAAAEALKAGLVQPADLLSFGDDYELLFTAPAELRGEVEEAARRSGVPVTRIGHMKAGNGVHLLDDDGNLIEVQKRGYTHA